MNTSKNTSYRKMYNNSYSEAPARDLVNVVTVKPYSTRGGYVLLIVLIVVAIAIFYIIAQVI